MSEKFKGSAKSQMRKKEQTSLVLTCIREVVTARNDYLLRHSAASETYIRFPINNLVMLRSQIIK